MSRRTDKPIAAAFVAAIVGLGTYAVWHVRMLPAPAASHARIGGDYERDGQRAQQNGPQRGIVRSTYEDVDRADNRGQEGDGQNAPSWIQAAAASFTFFATVALVYFARTQVRIYWVQTRVLLKQERLARTQAEIIREQVKIARGEPFLFIVTRAPLANTFRLSPSAILFNNTEEFGFEEVPVLQFWVKNYGDSPAILIDVGARLTISASEPSPQFSYPVVTMPGERVIPPSLDAGPFPAILRPGQSTVSRAVYGDLKAGRQFIWLFGEVRYDAIWSEYFIMRFCWRYDLGADEFMPFPPERNYAEKRPHPQGTRRARAEEEPLS